MTSGQLALLALLAVVASKQPTQMRIRGILQMDKTAFLKSILPYYKQAEQQEDLHRFLDILVPIWIDRYPVEEYYPIICNNPLLHEEAIAEIRETLGSRLKSLTYTTELPPDMHWDEEVTLKKMGRTSMEPLIPELDFNDDEVRLSSAGLIAYVNGEDPGTPCGHPHLTGHCIICAVGEAEAEP